MNGLTTNILSLLTDDITLAFSELEDENDSYGGLIDNVSLVKI